MVFLNEFFEKNEQTTKMHENILVGKELNSNLELTEHALHKGITLLKLSFTDFETTTKNYNVVCVCYLLKHFSSFLTEWTQIRLLLHKSNSHCLPPYLHEINNVSKNVEQMT